MKSLIIIPARLGSKGLPHKNKKKLSGKRLIEYTIEFALQIKKEQDIICVTSNDPEIIKISNKFNSLTVLKRSDNLSTDNATTNSVIIDVINSFEVKFEAVVLLQPTSPFRKLEDYTKMCNLFNNDTDMVVSVRESKSNPYFNLFEENKQGVLVKSKKGHYTRRQDCPPIFEFNGSIYIIKVSSIIKFGLNGFKKIKKFLMPFERSIDIDSIYDWKTAEYILTNLKNND